MLVLLYVVMSKEIEPPEVCWGVMRFLIPRLQEQRWPVQRQSMLPRTCRVEIALIAIAMIMYTGISTLHGRLNPIETSLGAVHLQQLHFASGSNMPSHENPRLVTPSAGETTGPSNVSVEVQAWLAQPPAVDPEILHKHVQKPEEGLDCSAASEADLQMLERVKLPPLADKNAPPSPRLLCSIYTNSILHNTSVRAITDTWGRRCDGFLAMSNETDPFVPAVNVVREGEEVYENLWQKVRSMVLYLHTHHREQFDWFMISGEDTFVLVENLRRLLGSDSVRRAAGTLGDQPLYLGRRLTLFDNKLFNAGGGGYVMNRAALDMLAQGIKGDQCDPHTVGSRGNDVPEDTRVGLCFSALGVEPFDTRDEAGRERFHLFAPGFTLTLRGSPSNWLQERSIGYQEGNDCCAPDSVSFHYVKQSELMRAYDAFLHGQCRPDTFKNDSSRVRAWVSATDLSRLDLTQVRNHRRKKDVKDADDPLCSEELDSGDEAVLRRTGVWQAPAPFRSAKAKAKGSASGRPASPSAKAKEEGSASGRVLCLALTQSSRHDDFVRALTDTWAPQCDGFLALSDKDDHSVPSLRVELEGTGPAAPHELWQLLGPSLMLLAKNKAMGYDWVLFVRDDTLVVMDNLRLYLASPKVQSLVGKRGENPVILGKRQHVDADPAYPSLHAGMVMNRAMVDTLVHEIDDLKCSPYEWGENGLLLLNDVSLGGCLYTLGLKPVDTRDDLGRERFHSLLPRTLLLNARHWDGIQTYDPREGLECCSPYTISLTTDDSADLVRKWHAKLHGHCPQGKPPPIPDPVQDLMLEDPMELVQWLDDAPAMDPRTLQKAHLGLPAPPVQCPSLSNGEHTWATHVRAKKTMAKHSPTILCAVLSSGTSKHNLVRGVAETWGRECDGFLAFGQREDRNISQVLSPDPSSGMLSLKRRKDETATAWQRAATAILYVFERHGAEFDYFLVAVDSLLVLMGSLRAQLRSQEARSRGPLYLGNRRHFQTGMTFLSMESGVLLDQTALATLAETIRQGDCAPYRGRYVYDDMGLGECLSLHGVEARHGHDKQGRPLFHPSPPSGPIADVAPTSVAFSLAHVAPQDRRATMASLHHYMHGRCDRPEAEGEQDQGAGQQRGSRRDRSSNMDMFARAAQLASTS